MPDGDVSIARLLARSAIRRRVVALADLAAAASGGCGKSRSRADRCVELKGSTWRGSWGCVST